MRWTADLHVDGTWDFDVYIPKNLSPNNVFKAIEKKLGQAEGVIVQADLPEAQMPSIAARMWGKSNAQNIKAIFFQRPDGSVVRFNRPLRGSWLCQNIPVHVVML
ncbi:hypothetical protein [Xanthomonas sacchari]